jgi:polyisoprenoid-binding protein YceI
MKILSKFFPAFVLFVSLAVLPLCAPFGAMAAPADAATWTVDATRSKLGFSGTQLGARFDGKFTRYSPTIVFDPDHLDASHIQVTADLASAATADAQRDTALPGTDWFDISHFPQARFETTAIRNAGAHAYEAVGTLTLRGVTQAFTVPLTFDISDNIAHIKGDARVRRTAFGIGQGQWSSGQWVGLDVDIHVDLFAKKRTD